jgi:PIN domain nuclease of toxin-antitoxin system
VNLLLDTHENPFDRMLIAQALIEGYEIVTTDETFSRYEVAVLDPTSGRAGGSIGHWM